MYDAIQQTHSELIEAGSLAKQFVSNNQTQIARMLEEAQRAQDERTAKSRRSEHAEWFEGTLNASTFFGIAGEIKGGGQRFGMDEGVSFEMICSYWAGEVPNLEFKDFTLAMKTMRKNVA